MIKLNEKDDFLLGDVVNSLKYLLLRFQAEKESDVRQAKQDVYAECKGIAKNHKIQEVVGGEEAIYQIRHKTLNGACDRIADKIQKSADKAKQ